MLITRRMGEGSKKYRTHKIDKIWGWIELYCYTIIIVKDAEILYFMVLKITNLTFS